MRDRGGRRPTLAVAATLLALASTSGCGSDPSPYCAAVEKYQTSLETFGSKKTEAGFTGYATMFQTISKVAPKPVDEQWASLGRATAGVVTAHESVGLPLQDMDDTDEVSTLSAGDLDVLDKAYERFNSTTSQRQKVVADAAETCDIEVG